MGLPKTCVNSHPHILCHKLSNVSIHSRCLSETPMEFPVRPSTNDWSDAGLFGTEFSWDVGLPPVTETRPESPTLSWVSVTSAALSVFSASLVWHSAVRTFGDTDTETSFVLCGDEISSSPASMPGEVLRVWLSLQHEDRATITARIISLHERLSEINV